MPTDPARIVEWVLSRLREEAPFDSIEELLERAEELAEEIEEQSKGGIGKEQVMSWLEDYAEELIGLLEPVVEEEDLEEMARRLRNRIMAEVAGVVRRELRGLRWYGEEAGEEEEENGEAGESEEQERAG